MTGQGSPWFLVTQRHLSSLSQGGLLHFRGSWATKVRVKDDHQDLQGQVQCPRAPDAGVTWRCKDSLVASSFSSLSLRSWIDAASR